MPISQEELDLLGATDIEEEAKALGAIDEMEQIASNEPQKINIPPVRPTMPQTQQAPFEDIELPKDNYTKFGLPTPETYTKSAIAALPEALDMPGSPVGTGLVGLGRGIIENLPQGKPAPTPEQAAKLGEETIKEWGADPIASSLGSIAMGGAPTGAGKVVSKAVESVPEIPNLVKEVGIGAGKIGASKAKNIYSSIGNRLEAAALKLNSATRPFMSNEQEGFRQALAGLKETPEESLKNIKQVIQAETKNIENTVQEAIPMLQQAEASEAKQIANGMYKYIELAKDNVGLRYQNEISKLNEPSKIPGDLLSKYIAKKLDDVGIVDNSIKNNIMSMVDRNVAKNKDSTPIGELINNLYSSRKLIGNAKKTAYDGERLAEAANYKMASNVLDNIMDELSPAHIKEIKAEFRPLYAAEDTLDDIALVKAMSGAKEVGELAKRADVSKITKAAKRYGDEFEPSVKQRLGEAIPEDITSSFIGKAKVAALKKTDQELEKLLPEGLQGALKGIRNANARTEYANDLDKIKIFKEELEKQGVVLGNTPEEVKILKLIENYGSQLDDLNVKAYGKGLSQVEEEAKQQTLSKLIRLISNPMFRKTVAVGTTAATGILGHPALALVTLPASKFIESVYAAGHRPLEALQKYAKGQAELKQSIENLAKLRTETQARILSILDNNADPKANIVVKALSRGIDAVQLERLLDRLTASATPTPSP